VRAVKRLSEELIQQLRGEIAGAQGNEVFALGYMNEQGLVSGLRVLARGNKQAVLALDADWYRAPQADGEAEAKTPDVLIHNHPSNVLSPSDADLLIAARAAEQGIGSFIVDNQVRAVYVVAEPIRRKPRKKLQPRRIRAALEAGGAIARRLESFELRPSQLDLMELIIQAFNDDALAAAEAGTGVGKSFAYLLPAMTYALDNDERIVISTATITLQQQLYEKDIPLMIAALGKKIKTVLVKGRGNYLCRRRFEDAVREPGILEEEQNLLQGVLAWAGTTRTGSRSDLSLMLPETLWGRINSEADLCMGMRCPERERCFMLALRKECADARILVVNHHLLFADLAARYQGAGYDNTVVLPPYRRVVIDEAHTIEGAATSFLSQSFSRVSIYRHLGRLYRRRLVPPTGLLPRFAALNGLDLDDPRIAVPIGRIQKIRDAVDALDAAALELCRDGGTFRFGPSQDRLIRALASGPLQELRRELLFFLNAMGELLEQFPPEEEDDPAAWEIRAVLRRLEAAGTLCASFSAYQDHQAEVLWVERHTRAGSASGPWAQLTVTPLDVAPVLRNALFAPNKTVVCVSATLTVAASPGLDAGEQAGIRGAFAYWMNRIGINLVANREMRFGCFPSPFPYEQAVLLAIPSDAPLPDQGRYQSFVDQAAMRLAETAGGSALILFTSYEALGSAYRYAKPVLEQQGIRCLKQGDDDRTRLLQTFLADESSVLFATDSFWEGVDAPGNTLRLVILCRLPFKAPNDPVFEARCEALEKKGRNAFMELSLPESVMKFKQGFGRLIRGSGDHGVVAVLDGRVLRKRYGAYFLQSIPKTRTGFGEFSSLLREVERFLFDRSR
jgi:ATP-dependent DNA helicase DinG